MISQVSLSSYTASEALDRLSTYSRLNICDMDLYCSDCIVGRWIEWLSEGMRE